VVLNLHFSIEERLSKYRMWIRAGAQGVLNEEAAPKSIKFFQVWIGPNAFYRRIADSSFEEE